MIEVERFIVGYISTNCYLLNKEGSDEAVLIDPAMGFDRISARCAQKGVSVKHILLTHGHFDHIYEAKRWQDAGAKIYIHSSDENKLRDGQGNCGNRAKLAVPPCEADVILTDGQRLELSGITFQVIHTPGHTAGSASFLTDEMLFSGDTLFEGDYGRTDFADGSFDEIKKSIFRLFKLEGDYTVYPGHGDKTTLSAERASNAILYD